MSERVQVFQFGDAVSVADKTSPFEGWFGEVIDCIPGHFHAGAPIVISWRYRVYMTQSMFVLTFSESQLQVSSRQGTTGGVG